MNHESEQAVRLSPIEELREDAVCLDTLRNAGELALLIDTVAQSACEAVVKFQDGEEKKILESVLSGLLGAKDYRGRVRGIERKRRKAETVDRSKQIAEHHAELTQLYEAGDNDGYLETARSFKPTSKAYPIEPYTRANFQSDTQSVGGGLCTGYEELDKYISIHPESLTVIGARTSHGKTALLVNIMCNMIDLYPDKAFAFISYEQTRRQVCLRMLQRESGVVIDRCQNAREIHRYIRGYGTRNADLETARAKLEELGKSERLFIQDKPYTVEDLVGVIRDLNAQGVAAVFVDYLGQIPTAKPLPTRQATIQHISNELKNAAKRYHVPILAASQLNREARDYPRLENFRESDDQVFDAHTVLALVNSAMIGVGVDEPSESVKLALMVLKNRDGQVGKTIPLCFHLPTQRITEPKDGGQWDEDKHIG